MTYALKEKKVIKSILGNQKTLLGHRSSDSVDGLLKGHLVLK